MRLLDFPSYFTSLKIRKHATMGAILPAFQGMTVALIGTRTLLGRLPWCMVSKYEHSQLQAVFKCTLDSNGHLRRHQGRDRHVPYGSLCRMELADRDLRRLATPRASPGTQPLLQGFLLIYLGATGF